MRRHHSVQIKPGNVQAASRSPLISESVKDNYAPVSVRSDDALVNMHRANPAPAPSGFGHASRDQPMLGARLHASICLNRKV